MDLSNSVIMPREDFIELQTAAWDSPPTTIRMKVATTVQTFLFFTFFAASTTATAWGVAQALNWYDEEALKRKMREDRLRETAK